MMLFSVRCVYEISSNREKFFFFRFKLIRKMNMWLVLLIIMVKKEREKKELLKKKAKCYQVSI